MKPAAFDYIAPTSLGEALDALANRGDDGRIIAGGQSLGPLLNLRLARPGVLLDINGLPELDNLEVSAAGGLSVGALTRHRSVETSKLVAAGWPLLAEAASEIGHRAIRNRGTVGGSVSHADPAAELPAAFVALDATFQVSSAAGERDVPASEFFTGPFSTVLGADEMLTRVTVPPTGDTTAQTWIEFSRRHGDFGVVGVAAVLGVEENVVTAVRLVYSGADWAPWRPGAAADALVGAAPSEDVIGDVAEAVAAESSPPSDIHASAAHRRRLIATLTSRALKRCAARLGVGVTK